MFQRYLSWLAENGETQESFSFQQWCTATFPGDTSIQNLAVVGEVVSGNVSKQRGAIAVSEVTSNADEDLQAGLTALARNRMSRVSTTMEFVDRVEQRLMQRVNVEEASIDQLLGVGRLLRNSLKDDLTLVAEVVKARRDVPVEASRNFNLSFTENVINVGDDATKKTMSSRDSRDRSRNILESMISIVNKKDDSSTTA